MHCSVPSPCLDWKNLATSKGTDYYLNPIWVILSFIHIFKIPFLSMSVFTKKIYPN